MLLPNYGPGKSSSDAHWPFHSLALYILPRLVFCTMGMNTGHGVSPPTLRPGLETEEGISWCKYGPATHICIDRYLLMPTFSVWLYGNLSFEIGIQSLQFHAYPKAGPPSCQKQWSFLCTNWGCKTEASCKDPFKRFWCLENRESLRNQTPRQEGKLRIELLIPSQKPARVAACAQTAGPVLHRDRN